MVELENIQKEVIMYNSEFEGLILGGMWFEEYNALVAEINADEAENEVLGSEYEAFCAEIDKNVDLDEMARYYGKE